MTGRIISLDAAIEALKAEYMADDTGCATDIAYDLAVTDCIKALSALPAVGGLRYERANGRTIMEMRERLSPAMHNAGDCVLIWVNEGDLCLLPAPPEIE